MYDNWKPLKNKHLWYKTITSFEIIYYKNGVILFHSVNVCLRCKQVYRDRQRESLLGFLLYESQKRKVCSVCPKTKEICWICPTTKEICLIFPKTKKFVCLHYSILSINLTLGLNFKNDILFYICFSCLHQNLLNAG